MRSTILLSTLLASTSLVLAQATNSTNNGTTITCGETCHTIIDKGCAKDDLACQCKSDYEVQIPFWKCLYDGCPMEAASLAIGVYGLACSEAIANATAASKTSTSAAAIPTSAPASSFRLPSKQIFLAPLLPCQVESIVLIEVPSSYQLARRSA
jgi:hypothetical protein